MITISVGMFAYNEESVIANSIESVLKQSIFSDQFRDELSVELVVVPNGCTDNTSKVAQNTIDSMITGLSANAGAWVAEIPEGGKHLAWNYFVHKAGNQNSDYTILIDADITLPNEHVLKNLVDCLIAHPDATIAGGVPTKHIDQRSQKTILDRVSLGATSLRLGMQGIFAGCLYCGRGEVLRSFKLPAVLMGEDSFVRAMIVTKEFTQPDDPSLIVRADDAMVIFEAYTSPTEVLRNKTRRMFEASINAILYTKLWNESTVEISAGELIKKWDDDNPNWSHELIKVEFEHRGYWKIPKQFIYSQFRQLKNHTLRKRIALFPVALATLPLNALAVHRANKIAASGDLQHLWDKAGS